MENYEIYFLICFVLSILYFAIKYFTIERRVQNWKEFLLLIFFPYLGYGKWVYSNELRKIGTTKYPEQWYIYKMRVRVNIYIFIVLGLALLAFFLESSGIIGTASRENNHFSLVGFALFADILMTLIFLFFFGVIFTVYILLFITFVKAPLKKIRMIERIQFKA